MKDIQFTLIMEGIKVIIKALMKSADTQECLNDFYEDYGRYLAKKLK